MKDYDYSVSTNAIWTSFDNGTVEAESLEDARVKAIEKLEFEFKKVNDALASVNETVGHTIHFNKDSVEVRVSYWEQLKTK